MAAAAPITIQPITGNLSDLQRLTALLDRAEPRVRRRFLDLVGAARANAGLERISDLISEGRINEAIAVVDDIGPGLATALEQAYTAAGLSAAAALRPEADRFIDFNSLNARSVETLGATRARLVAEITTSQRATLVNAVSDGFATGLRPDQIARDVRQGIGLTNNQRLIVQNYRRQLEQGSLAALDRQLRDRRFDSTVRRAARGEIALSGVQIDRMVERYRERWVQYRSNVIARTETTAAVNAGDMEMFQQAIDEGAIDAEAVVQRWVTAGDERVRSSHRAMNGQEQPMGEPFMSGAGNRLRFPGDPLGPASDTIQCRCVIRRTLSERGRR